KAASLLVPGTCTIQASQTGTANYLAATPVNQSFQVSSGVAAGFTIDPDPDSQTVKRGNLAAFLLRLNSTNGFKGSVNLSCSGGPPGSKCADFPRAESQEES